MKALALVLLAGCTVGGSASMVGRYRAQRLVDSTACVQTTAPGASCEKRITIGRDIPARRFTTMTFTFGDVGYVQQRGTQGDGSYVGHGFTVGGHLEYLYGRGRWAIGGRYGLHAPMGFDDRQYVLMPISVVAHLGATLGSIYVGGGYSPYATEEKFMPVGDDKVSLYRLHHHNSTHVFLGTRFWLTRKQEQGISFNPELRADRVGEAVLFSTTANLGLHF